MKKNHFIYHKIGKKYHIKVWNILIIFFSILIGLGSIVTFANLEVETNLTNAIQTIKEIVITSDGSDDSNKILYHINSGGNGLINMNLNKLPAGIQKDLAGMQGINRGVIGINKASNNLIIIPKEQFTGGGGGNIIGGESRNYILGENKIRPYEGGLGFGFDNLGSFQVESLAATTDPTTPLDPLAQRCVYVDNSGSLYAGECGGLIYDECIDNPGLCSFELTGDICTQDPTLCYDICTEDPTLCEDPCTSNPSLCELTGDICTEDPTLCEDICTEDPTLCEFSMGDNLGDHIALQNIQLGENGIVYGEEDSINNPATDGIFISQSGNVSIGDYLNILPDKAKLTIDGDIKIGYRYGMEEEECSGENEGNIRYIDGCFQGCDGDSRNNIVGIGCEDFGGYCGGDLPSNAIPTSLFQTNFLDREYDQTPGVCTFVCQAGYNHIGTGCTRVGFSGSNINNLTGLVQNIINNMTGLTVNNLTGLVQNIINNMTGLTVNNLTGLVQNIVNNMTGLTVNNLTGLVQNIINNMTGLTVNNLTGLVQNIVNNMTGLTISGDNLGNHTATTGLKLNNNRLSNDGGNKGIKINNNGTIGINFDPTGAPGIFGLYVSGYTYIIGNLYSLNFNTTGTTNTNKLIINGLANSGNRCLYIDNNGEVKNSMIDCSIGYQSGGTSSGDNLGNHTATTGLKLNNNRLSNDGDNEGIFIDNSGNVFFSKNSPTGLGTRFMRLPGKSALRIGIVNSSSREETNIGNNSFIFGQNNKIQSSGSSILGGLMNRIGIFSDFSSILGGELNFLMGNHGIIGGGFKNNLLADYGFIGGGYMNTGAGLYTIIGGGINNSTMGQSTTIGGGALNEAKGLTTTIGGGNWNHANGSYTTIAGGDGNFVNGRASNIGGGQGNSISSGRHSTIGGGRGNIVISESGSTIAGGSRNRLNGNLSTIAGGSRNTITGEYTTIGGGRSNNILGSKSIIGGGLNNNIIGDFGFIGGGRSNKIYSGTNSVIVGGLSNTLTGDYSSILGGGRNTINGNFSIAAGRLAQVNHDRTAIFNLSTVSFASAKSGTFLVNAPNGVGINTNNPQATLEVNSLLKLTPVTYAPVPCNDNTRGSIYYTSTSNNLCLCKGSERVAIPSGVCPTN